MISCKNKYQDSKLYLHNNANVSINYFYNFILNGYSQTSYIQNAVSKQIIKGNNNNINDKGDKVHFSISAQICTTV